MRWISLVVIQLVIFIEANLLIRVTDRGASVSLRSSQRAAASENIGAPLVVQLSETTLTAHVSHQIIRDLVRTTEKSEVDHTVSNELRISLYKHTSGLLPPV